MVDDPTSVNAQLNGGPLDGQIRAVRRVRGNAPQKLTAKGIGDIPETSGATENAPPVLTYVYELSADLGVAARYDFVGSHHDWPE